MGTWFDLLFWLDGTEVVTYLRRFNFMQVGGKEELRTISASGYKSPASMAHIPVPVPISNILKELEGFGHRCSFPPCTAVKSACVISRRSRSFSSLGKLYAKF